MMQKVKMFLLFVTRFEKKKNSFYFVIKSTVHWLTNASHMTMFKGNLTGLTNFFHTLWSEIQGQVQWAQDGQAERNLFGDKAVGRITGAQVLPQWLCSGIPPVSHTMLWLYTNLWGMPFKCSAPVLSSGCEELFYSSPHMDLCGLIHHIISYLICLQCVAMSLASIVKYRTFLKLATLALYFKTLLMTNNQKVSHFTCIRLFVCQWWCTSCQWFICTYISTCMSSM